MAGEVPGHRVDRVGKIFPCTGDARHIGLPAQTPLGADFARDTRHFTSEAVELVHHRVQRFFELQNLAADIDRDLARQIAVGDGRRDLGDVSYLAGEVAGHEVHIVRQIFPRAANSWHLRLPAQFAFGTHFTRYAGNFAGERIELIHHRVDGVFEFEDFAFNIDRDFARQIAAGNGCCNFGDVPHLSRQVTGHGVDGVRKIFPGARHAHDNRLTAQASRPCPLHAQRELLQTQTIAAGPPWC